MEKDESLRKFSRRLQKEGFKLIHPVFYYLVLIYLVLSLGLLALALVLLTLGHPDRAIGLVAAAGALTGIASGVVLLAYLAALTKRLQELAG